MDRRSFIAAGVVAAPVAGLAATGAAAGAATLPRPVLPGTEALRVLTTRIVNRDQFPGAQTPPTGTHLQLERRAGRFDPMRIAVLDPGGRTLGFLPPAQVGVLARLMDAGATAHATSTGPRSCEVWLHAG